ncbi:MAG: CAP domain-containing protein [Patescibacteria group bacterium]
MKKTFKKYFVPHKENDFEPHILRTKRIWFYGALAVVIKAIIVIFVLFLPAEAFLMPDILAVEQNKIISLTNNFRVKNHLPVLSENSKLDASAVNKAEDMAYYKYFSHTSPGERHLSYFISQVGYNYLVAGENLAMGYFDAGSMMKAWQASPTHRANLLDKDFTEIGTAMANGVYENNDTIYAVQHFGQPRLVPDSNASTTASSSLTSAGTDYVMTTTTVQKVLAVRTLGMSTPNSTADGVIGSETSFLRKYVAANNMLGDTEPVFGLSKMIYLSLIIFFTLALLLNVFVELKMQRQHAIARSLALLGVLVGLWLV